MVLKRILVKEDDVRVSSSPKSEIILDNYRFPEACSNLSPVTKLHQPLACATKLLGVEDVVKTKCDVKKDRTIDWVVVKAVLGNNPTKNVDSSYIKYLGC